MVKSNDYWVVFDDENFQIVSEVELSKYFGDPKSPGSGYIFFYQAVDFDYSSIISSMKVDTEEEELSSVPMTKESSSDSRKKDIFNEKEGWRLFSKKKDSVTRDEAVLNTLA